MNTANKPSQVELIEILKGQCGDITWPELERHFARGVLIKVSPTLNLIDVAVCLINDDKITIENWMKDRKINNASDEDAQAWSTGTIKLTAVVAAPWVLVQTN